MKENSRKVQEDKCCGNCCWFYGEDTDGWGFCAIRKGELTEYMHCGDLCNDANGNIFVSRQEMRHHMAVMLQSYRRNVHFYGKPDKQFKSIYFAYKYMKVFGNL